MFVTCLLQRPSQCHGSVSVDESETGRRPKGHDRRLMTITVLWRYSGHSYVRRFRPGRSPIRMTHIDVAHLVQIETWAGSKPRRENSPWRMAQTSVQSRLSRPLIAN
jgi:hypothetical protein